MSQTFTLTKNEKGVANLDFDLHNEKVNKFSGSVMLELETVLNDIKNDHSIQLLVLKSSKKDVFIAGADIKELVGIKNAQEAQDKAERGQEVFNLLESLPYPTLAVIDGACLGGGCEFILACDYRIASDNPKAMIGLPEVNLGIIPGWGGTQRLPKLVGLQASLSIILTGKPIPSKKAFKMGLVDQLSAQEFLEKNTADFIDNILKKKVKKSKNKKNKLLNIFLEKTALGRRLVFNQSRKAILKTSKGNYPAPLKALEVIEESVGLSLERGLAVEKRAFGEIATTKTCENLIQVFFSNEMLKKNVGIDLNPDLKTNVQQAGVLGAGVMGGGIAWLFSNKNIPVRIKDLNWDAIAMGFASAHKIYGQLKKIRKIKDKGILTKMSFISASTHFSGFQKANVVVEAIVENIDIKKKALAELESHVNEETILCSNTSALSINSMSESLQRPENFIGMHFFNPVNRMPLVEIIPSEKTSVETLQHIVSLTKKLGKTPLIVQDCAGFLVNRILLPYINEAARILEESSSVEHIDQLIEKFGLPMGPFTLADEVGIDVGFHVAKILENAYGERMKVSELLCILHEDKKYLGKKGKKGFYVYNKKDKNINESIRSCVQSVQKKLSLSVQEIDDQVIVQRCIYIMINEAALCIEESVVESAQHLDMGMIMGTGFPPFRGGLLKYADDIGLDNVVETLHTFSRQYGERFKPAPLLVRLAEEKSKFYSMSTD